MSKQLSKGFSTLKEALVVNPSDMNSLHLLALVLSAQKKYKEALDVIETAIEEYPYEFSLLLTKVKLSEQCHGPQSALVVCHGLLKLWNDLYYENEQNEFEREEQNTEETLAKSPSFSMTKSLNDSKLLDATASIKKMALVDTSSLDDDGTGSIAASVRIEKALSEAPSGTLTTTHQVGMTRTIAMLSKLWLITAECFINLEDATQAGGCILEASSIFPLSPDVLYMRGRLNELQENTLEAIACYESALSIHPHHKAARQRVGLLYHERGDCALAEKILRACILYDTSNHTAWNDLGIVLESTGRFDESADCFLTALRLEGSAPISSFTSIPRAFRAFDTS
ncbi:tetratricopeptide repeat protein 7B-like [Clytia hemisphaerica]